MPLIVKCELSYVKQLESHLNSYHNFLNTFLEKLVTETLFGADDKETYIENNKIFSNKILNVLNAYNFGKRIQAVNEFRELMADFERVICNLSLSNTIYANTHFFRLRTDPKVLEDRTSPTLDPKFILFHIPFSLRRHVNNQRFSGHGIPCLYCANNLNTAWVETKSPGLMGIGNGELNIGIYSNSENIECIDYSIRSIDSLYSKAVTDKQYIIDLISYLEIYPFIASLHTKIDYPEPFVSFHNEYLFPSLLMDYFLSSEGTALFQRFKSVNGIKYSSVAVSNPFNCHNYVLPAKIQEDVQYCTDLTRIFLQDKSYHYMYEDQIIAHLGSSRTITEKDISNLEIYLSSKI